MPRRPRQFDLRGVMTFVAILAFVLASLRSEAGARLLSAIAAGLFTGYCLKEGDVALYRRIRKAGLSFFVERNFLGKLRHGVEVAFLLSFLLVINGSMFLFAALVTLPILISISGAIRP